MTEVQDNTLSNLANTILELVSEKGVSWTIRAWEEAAQLQLSGEDREKYLHFLLNATAVIVQQICRFSNVPIKAHAGIDPESNTPFIEASSADFKRFAKWYARPVTLEGMTILKITRGWHPGGTIQVTSGEYLVDDEMKV